MRSKSATWLPALCAAAVLISLLSAFCAGPASPQLRRGSDTVALTASSARVPAWSGDTPDPAVTPGAVRVRGWYPGKRTMVEWADVVGDGVQQGVVCADTLRPGGSHQRGCPGPAPATEICGQKTRLFRHVGGITKREVCARQGISRKACPGYEDDHLIPLCLGGSDAPENHWAQPWARAAVKDGVETALCRAVCGGALDLATAQKAIAFDWRQAGRLVEIDVEERP